MNPAARRLSDREVLLEQCTTFECHSCGAKPSFLYRVRMQEWPSAASSPTEYERFVIRRRLVCDDCFRSFVYPEHAICAFTTIAGKVWCLRQRPEKRAVIYTRERWLAYVDSVRGQRLK
jgi:hypothetical protein